MKNRIVDHSISPKGAECTPEKAKANRCGVGRAPDSYIPLATCELCREDGGCHFHIAATSLVPGQGEKDPDLKIGRSTLFALMKQLVDGVPLIEFSDVGGKRLVDGASKCRYIRTNKNRPSSRGGKRKKPGDGDDSPTGPATPKLIPPSPPINPPIGAHA